MGVAASAKPTDVRSQRQVSRHLFPDKVERVVGEPHVLAAARDEVTFLRGIVLDRARLAYQANVTLPLEQSERRIPGRGGSGLPDEAQAQKNQETWYETIHSIKVIDVHHFQQPARTLVFPNSSGSAEFVQLTLGIHLR
jgi:hypothetical protein